MGASSEPLPFRPKDWVDCGSGSVGQVKRVYRCSGEVLLDVVLYDRKGNRLGRRSPAEGGPRGFEPACPAEQFRRIAEPSFPLQLRWVPTDHGSKVAEWHAGKPLPPANWTPPKPRAGSAARVPDDRYRKALEAIADGHNNARELAEETLGRLAHEASDA